MSGRFINSFCMLTILMCCGCATTIRSPSDNYHKETFTGTLSVPTPWSPIQFIWVDDHVLCHLGGLESLTNVYDPGTNLPIIKSGD